MRRHDALAECKDEREQREREDGKGRRVQDHREPGRVLVGREMHAADGGIVGVDLDSQRAHKVEHERKVDDHRKKIVNSCAVRRHPNLQDEERGYWFKLYCGFRKLGSAQREEGRKGGREREGEGEGEGERERRRERERGVDKE